MCLMSTLQLTVQHVKGLYLDLGTITTLIQ